MKTIILLFWMGASLFAREYWIQVISVKKETMIPSPFMERVQKSTFAYKTVEKEATKKIWLGSFITAKEALEALPKVRAEVAPDAFITWNNDMGPIIETVPGNIALIKISNKPAGAVTANREPIADIDEAIEAKAVSQMNAEAQSVSAEKSMTAEAPCICICDKKAYKKAEIAAAVDFYRTSPYYRFGAPD